MREVLSGLEFDTHIRNLVPECENDEWAVAIQGRIDSIADLFSTDSVDHQMCLIRLAQKLSHELHKVWYDRPQNDAAMIAFKRESECNNEMYTLCQLHDIMCGTGLMVTM